MSAGRPAKPFAIKTRHGAAGALKFWYTNCFYCRRHRQTFGPDSAHSRPAAKTPQLLISECSYPPEGRGGEGSGVHLTRRRMMNWRRTGGRARAGAECECQELSAASGGRWSTKKLQVRAINLQAKSWKTYGAAPITEPPAECYSECSERNAVFWD